ncbi:MAG: PfkB family carbohydrate kinase [Actinomycetes bacterium]
MSVERPGTPFVPEPSPEDVVPPGPLPAGSVDPLPGLPLDPLRGLRPAGAPPVDLFVAGTVFFDMIFSGLSARPSLGTEVLTQGLGSGPGGVANLAVAARRLGLRTSLASAFGEDVYGDYLWSTLVEQERVDLSPSRRFPGWATPVTVSLAYDRDRSMVTYQEPSPLGLDALVGEPPAALACLTDLGGCGVEWARRARQAGAMLFAGACWDPTGAWSPDLLARLDGCEALLVNLAEASAYARTRDVRRALARLAEHVPVVVITCGRDGAQAVDARTGEYVAEPGLAVRALDPTGAGDVFAASFVLGTLAGWPLAPRLRFANLAAGLSVGHYGGSLGAPCWHVVAEWWARTCAAPGSDDRMRAAYGFVADLLPADIVPDVPRATPTIRLRVPEPRPAS